MGTSPPPSCALARTHSTANPAPGDKLVPLFGTQVKGSASNAPPREIAVVHGKRILFDMAPCKDLQDIFMGITE